MPERFTNNAASTLNGAINNSVTTLVVTSAASFPTSGNFRLILGTNPSTAEIVLVTGVSGTTFTVVRGQESTSAQSWPDLTPVTHVLTAGAVNTLQQTLRGKPLDVSLETIGASQDGYVLQWSNTDGYWKSSQFAGSAPKYTVVLNNVASNGTYPTTPPTNWTGSYTSSGGMCEFVVVAQALSGTTNSQISMNLNLGSGIIATTTVNIDSVGIHTECNPIHYAAVLPPGTYTITVTLTGTGACANSSDHCTITVLETFNSISGTGSTTSLPIIAQGTLASNVSIASNGSTWTDLITLNVTGSSFFLDSRVSGTGTNQTARLRFTIDGNAAASSYATSNAASGGANQAILTHFAAGLSSGSHTVVLQGQNSGSSAWTINAASNPIYENAVLYAFQATQGPAGVAGGDLSGTYPNPIVAKIRENAVASQTLGSPHDGYVLQWSNADGYWSAKNIGITSTEIQAHDTTYSPIALYQFNGNLNDSSGNGRNLTLATGTVRYANISPNLSGFYFDGSTRLTSSNSAFQLAGDMTVECLISITTGGIIVEDSDAGESQSQNYLYQINAGAGSNTIASFWEFGSGTDVTYSNPTASYTTNRLMHFAFVRQGGQVTYYVNGKLFGATSTGLTPPDGAGGSQVLSIGQSLGGSAALTGIISSLKFIGRALSGSEVLSEYQKTLGYTSSNAGPFITIGNDILTSRTLSIDPNFSKASQHLNSSLFVYGQLAIGQSNSSSSMGFGYVSDAVQTFTVPANTFNIVVKMWGPGGGSGNFSATGGGGAGGYSTGLISVNPGDTLYIVAGSGGKAPASSSSNGGNGGWPGGGYGTRGDASGGGGGGYSGIFTGSTPSQANALMIAGGGGGSTGFGSFGAGGGGGTTGGSGLGTSGKGGTQIAGGLNGNGTSSPSYTAGSALAGGVAFTDQTTSQSNDCGGGGSGYFGGGAGVGDGRSSGGGSGFLNLSRVSNGAMTNGPNAGSGNTSTPPFNTTDPFYVAGVGVGAIPGSNGGDGYVVLQWGSDTYINANSISFPVSSTLSVPGSSTITFQSGATNSLAIGNSKVITSVGRRIATNVKTTSYTVVPTDEVIIIGTLSAGVTITLPASPTAGDTYVIKDQGGTSATYNVIVAGNGNNIDGASTYTLNANYESLTVVFANSSWSII